MKRLPLLLFVAAVSQAAGGDRDFDGVDDARDRCPGTPFELTVSADGCAVEQRTTSAVFIAGIGTSYARGTYGGPDTVDSLSADVSAALYLGDFYASALGGYSFRGADDPTVSSDDGGGFSDLFLAAGYTFAPTTDLYLTPGIHVKLATAGDGLGTGENDYGASLQALYRLGDADVYALYGYTVTGDSAEVSYRDIAFGSFGAGMYTANRSYLSLSYDVSQAYVAGVEDLQSLTLFGVFPLYDTLSLQATYSLGLSDSASAHYLSAMLLMRF